MQFYLTNLAIKTIKNIDTISFFNKLSASNLDQENINYLFFLNPQGRYVADIFFIPEKNYIIATKNILNNLENHLKYYDLNSEINFEDHTMRVYYTNNKTDAYHDPRITQNHILISNNLYPNNDLYYKKLRFENTIAEFEDFEYEKSIILNFGNIGRFISNNKGCFPGQELTCYVQNQGSINKTVDICDINDPKIIKKLINDNNKCLAYKYI